MIRDRYIVFDGEQFNVIIASHIDLSTMQEAVGGLIEPLFTEPMGKNEVTGYVNEEGLCIGLPINALRFVGNGRGISGVRQFAGNLLIIGLDREGDTILLTEAEVNAMLKNKERMQIDLAF